MVEEKPVTTNRRQGPAGPRAGTTGPAMTPKEIFCILRRHIWMIIILTILGFIAGGTGWFLLLRYAPNYTARTLIEVLPPVQKDPFEFRSAIVNKDIQYGYRLSMASLMGQQSTLQNLLTRDKIRETEWFRQFGKNSAERIGRAYEALEDNFSASAQRDGTFVVVSMTCGSKVESALIVNEMVDLFVASQGTVEREEVTEELTVLQDRRKSVQQELDYAISLLEGARTSLPEKYLDLEEYRWRDTTTMRLDSLQIEQDRLALDVTQTSSFIETLERQATGPVGEQIENQVETDPTTITLTMQKNLLEAELAGKLAKFGENHREIRRVRGRIEEIEARRQARRKKIAEQIRQANLQDAQDGLTALLAKLEELDKRKEVATRQKQDVDRARVLYQKRIKVRDERQEMLNSIKNQIEKQRMILQSPETAKVRKVGNAPEPLKVSSPKWELYFPAGTMLGFLCGLGLAFLIEVLNDLVRTPSDVGKHLHIPLLGVIPDSDEDAEVNKDDLFHVVRSAPYSIISESYRRLRTNFQLSDSKRNSKTLLFSSGMPGEGNTSVVVNLATAFAVEGKKVLLIDANFRKPDIDTIFAKTSEHTNLTEHPDSGLSGLLTDDSSFEEVVRSTDIEGLDIIGAGPLPASPTELLATPRMRQLIKQQRENYDYVLIDGPPVLLVSDTKILANSVDGVMLVFNAETTHRGAAQRAIRELTAADTGIIGCVLFAVKSLKGGYFREQFKSYRRYQKVKVAG